MEVDHDFTESEGGEELRGMHLKILYIFLLIFINGNTMAQNTRHGGGPVPTTDGIAESQLKEIKTSILNAKFMGGKVLKQKMLFDDPMGDGGMNSFGKTIVNYADLAGIDTLLDYNCGENTYDGHRGLDIEILNFFEMDERVPLLSAAPGVVIYSHDGEYDRNTEAISGNISNTVILSHSDGSDSWYLHMKKNSVAVANGDNVAAGDTIGFIGSSGYSTGPHIHFQIQQNDAFVDPFQGTCQQDSSRWTEQEEYVLRLPFELMDHGLTTIPLSWAMISERPPTKTHVTAPGPIYSWLRLRNVLGTDSLKWEFYANGTLWNEYGFSPGTTYSSSWWYIWWTLPNVSNFYGEWSLNIYRNDSLIAEQVFAYDDDANQLPTVDDLTVNINNDLPFNGEFTATDTDGSIFWYEVLSPPKNGAFKQYAGRKRKFTYIPEAGFVGRDSIILYVIDDENAQGGEGIYILKVVDSLTFIESKRQLSEDYFLSQNYPNPFNPVTTINYALPKSGDVLLTIYNLRGVEVARLINGEQPAGNHLVTWDASNVASGIYFYRLQAGEFVQVRKMVLLK